MSTPGVDSEAGATASVSRQEYGTPVDGTAPPMYMQQSSTFFRDNSPSYVPEHSEKKRKNRRKLRSKKVIDDFDNVDNVQSNCNGTLTCNVIEAMFAINLVQNTPDKIPENKVEKKIKKNLTEEMSPKHQSKFSVSQNKSKLPVTKNSRVYVNPLYLEEMALLENVSYQISPKRNKDTPKKPGKQDTPNRKKSSVNNNEEPKKFPEYMPIEQVAEGLKTGELLTGQLRINPKDFKMAYISNPIKLQQDILIESLYDRNRALDGDTVVIKIKNENEWKSSTQKTGYVVHIKHYSHPRTAVGILKLMPDKNKQFACFHPRDSKVPRIKIPFTDWPALFYDNADKYEQVLFLAKIKQWSDTKYALGNLLETIGMSGDIKTESIAILKENCIDITPYGDEFKKYYPSSSEISEEEIKNRIDLRKECIFTIDPLTARDLDDAVSCKELPNGNYEIGVHISDVTFYLKENTPLNEIVSERATSTYMVESVYHMLPRELCMLCSLLPGEEKLAFSVIWEMTPEGKIVNHKFSRTVINSCTQLAYEHAQMIIDNDFKNETLPKIHNGFTGEDIKKTVLILHKLSLILRRGRFDGGALRIDQPKLSFEIHPATCLPVNYSIYEIKDCHRLIEEFMLLANITVATRLKEDFPDIAFLRAHQEPGELMILQLQKFLEQIGIHLDIATAGSLQKSLWNYASCDQMSEARMLVLSCLCAKTMTRAKYFCANNCESPEEYWHYALSIPLYTHFTSPIRRYADVMVHRLLSASLGYSEKPSWNIDYVHEVAMNCNKQKYNAKRAGEQSLEMYYIHYIEQNQPVHENAVVMDVKHNFFEVILLGSGQNCKIYLNVSILDY